MYYLLVSVAVPDYKRPYVITDLYFFVSSEECYTQLKQLKIDFIGNFDTSEDDRILDLNITSQDTLVNELFENVSDLDIYYKDSYMSNPPFNYVIGEVTPGVKIPI
jgi:hypothetical protein